MFQGKQRQNRNAVNGRRNAVTKLKVFAHNRKNPVYRKARHQVNDILTNMNVRITFLGSKLKALTDDNLVVLNDKIRL